VNRVAESRAGDRKNLFVVAQLIWAKGNSAVRVRNISPSGALIEGDRLPPAHTAVKLGRGELIAEGELVWQVAGKAGLAFVEPVQPGDWLPMGAGTRKEDPGAISSSSLFQVAKDAPAHAIGAHSVSENLDRIRTLVEDLRMEIGFHTGPPQQTRAAIKKLETIHRMLGLQIDILQSLPTR
jgi:hypothetical protein